MKIYEGGLDPTEDGSQDKVYYVVVVLSIRGVGPRLVGLRLFTLVV